MPNYNLYVPKDLHVRMKSAPPGYWARTLQPVIAMILDNPEAAVTIDGLATQMLRAQRVSDAERKQRQERRKLKQALNQGWHSLQQRADNMSRKGLAGEVTSRVAGHKLTITLSRGERLDSDDDDTPPVEPPATVPEPSSAVEPIATEATPATDQIAEVAPASAGSEISPGLTGQDPETKRPEAETGAALPETSEPSAERASGTELPEAERTCAVGLDTVTASELPATDGQVTHGSGRSAPEASVPDSAPKCDQVTETVPELERVAESIEPMEPAEAQRSATSPPVVAAAAVPVRSPVRRGGFGGSR